MVSLLKDIFSRASRTLRGVMLIDRNRLFAIWEQEHLKRLLKHYQVDCVFDVGASNGQYARMLRRHAGFTGLIISFEPNPAAAAMARRLARSDPNWIVEQIALSSVDGTQVFNVMASPQFSSLSLPRHDEVTDFKGLNRVVESFEVETQTLSTAFNRLKIQYGFKRPFLKMDTQGYDVKILTNGGPAVQEFIGLQSELAVKKIYAESIDFRTAITAYENLGFELSAFVPNNAGHFPLLMEIDCIMIRRDVPAATT